MPINARDEAKRRWEARRTVALDGKFVRAGSRAVLPARCIKCAGEPDGEPLVVTSAWHHPLLYLLLPATLIYILAAVIVRKESIITVSVCDEHRRRRRHMIIFALALFVAGIYVIVRAVRMGQSPSASSGDEHLYGLLLLIAGVVVWKTMTKPFRIRQASETFIWFKASRAFTDLLRKD